MPRNAIIKENASGLRFAPSTSTEAPKYPDLGTFENLLTIILFTSGLVVFCWTSVRNWSGNETTIALQERRALNPRPSLRLTYPSIRTFPARAEAFYCDRFAFRMPLISALSLLRYRVFGITRSKDVLIGKAGWLFFLAAGGEDTASHANPFSDWELKYYAHLLDVRRAWLNARGIKYLYYVAPVASTIYPEMLPDNFRVKWKANPSRLDQLLGALANTTSVEFVDLRPTLLQAKVQGVLYHKTETHWNSLGAFQSTKLIVSRLRKWFPNMPPVSDSELRLLPEHFSNGDLPATMGLPPGTITEDTVYQDPCASRRWRISDDSKKARLEDEYSFRQPFSTEVPDPRLPTAVCIRDSYLVAQKVFLSNHFRRITYSWSNDELVELVKREKPDLVLQELCERFLPERRWLFTNPKEAYDDWNKERTLSTITKP